MNKSFLSLGAAKEASGKKMCLPSVESNSGASDESEGCESSLRRAVPPSSQENPGKRLDGPEGSQPSRRLES